MKRGYYGCEHRLGDQIYHNQEDNMTSKQTADRKTITCDELFEVHMLLLRWGQARLARQNGTAEDDHGLTAQSSSAADDPTGKAGTTLLSPETAETATPPFRLGYHLT